MVQTIANNYLRIGTSKKILLFSFFFFACVDTVLRLPQLEFLSAFRLLALLYLVINGLKYLKIYAKSFIFFAFAILYSYFCCLASNGSIQACTNAGVFWLFIFVCYFSISINFKYANFDYSMFKFLDYFTLLTIGLFLFENYTGINLFGYATKGEHSVFFYGINDFCSAIIVPGIIYAVLAIYKKKKKYYLRLALVVYAVFLADARASMLTIGIAVVTILLLKFGEKTDSKPIRRLVGLCWALMTVAVIAIIVNPTILGTSLQDLIVYPIRRILAMDYSVAAGSIDTRTSAMVIGIMELIHSKFLGIGLGNSTVVLSSYNMYGLKSMHNLFLSTITEMGLLAIVCVVAIIKYTVKEYANKCGGTLGCIHIIKIVALVCFPIMSMQSSEGLMSIYMFWISLFYVFIPRISENSEEIVSNIIT